MSRVRRRVPRLELKRDLPHPLSTVAGAHRFLLRRGFTADDYRTLRAISSSSRDGDPVAARFPDARERERLRGEVERLRARLIAALGSSPRALLRHDDMTKIGTGLSTALKVLSEPETPAERLARTLNEDRAKGGCSWWATLVLLGVAAQLGRRLDPIEIHALAVASEVWRERRDAASDLGDWRARHARCLRFAVRFAEEKPTATRERLLAVLAPERKRRRPGAASRRRSA